MWTYNLENIVKMIDKIKSLNLSLFLSSLPPKTLNDFSCLCFFFFLGKTHILLCELIFFEGCELIILKKIFNIKSIL